MNKLSNNIPNKIKQPSQCCFHCGKSYVKRVNLDKHLVICGLLQEAKKRPQLIIEEDENIPSQRKMFQMLIELGQKYNKLEEKLTEVNKWVAKRKKKINVLEWLNSNITPNAVFESIIDKITVNEEDIHNLLENSFYDVINDIFERTIYKLDEKQNPIYCFVQKQNIFYVYDSDQTWIELTKERLIKFLNKVHMKIIKAFYEWKKMKTSEIKTDDKFAILCDKTLVKLMSIEFKQESIFSRVRNMVFTKMKTDIKSLIEFDFEF
jgi:uncharacterized protein YeeX (DUF496 family)